MTPTEPSAKTQSPRTGIFASLCARLRLKGTRAPFSRRLALAFAFAITVLLAASAAPALAASLETPETGTAEPTTTTATLHGVVNPGGLGLAGGWQFHYAPSETECTGGGVAPALPEFTLGAKEAVEESVTELQPAKKYTFCLVASDLSNESASGALVPFETLPLPPEVLLGSEKASVNATGATLEATVNPNNQKTTYFFEYSTSEAEVLAGKGTKVLGAPPAAELEGFGGQGVGVPTGAVLAPGTTYFYRVVAENAQSVIEATPVQGPVQSFTTVPTPHTDPVTGVTATTAMLHGHLTLDSIETKYSFDYNTNGECANGSSTTPTEASAGTVSTEATKLEPGATYTVCLVTSNVFGSEVDPHVPLVQFPTPAAAPTIEAGSEKVSGETPFEATLEAQVNPDNQVTTYVFEYATEAAQIGTPAAITLKGEGPLSGYGEQTASAPTGHHLTPATTYHFRVVAENAAHEKTEGPIEAFTTPAAALPKIESETATAIATEAATLEASVNPEHQATTCSFQYATEESKLGTSEGRTASCTEPLGEGAAPVTGKATLTGLALHTVYFYRVLATNATGTATDATVQTFETENTVAPEVVAGSLSAVDLAGTSATFTARIDPQGAATIYLVEYGTTTAYGNTAPAHPETPPLTGRSPLTVSIPVTGLHPNTTYHWRLQATNAAGTTTTPDQTFSDPTAAASENCPNETLRRESNSQGLPDCRAYEMVTPPEKNGALIGSLFARHAPAEVSAEGTRVTAQTAQCFAAPQSCDGFRSTEGDPFAFQRTPTGWVTHPLAPPATETSSWTVNADTGSALFSAPSSADGPDEFIGRAPAQPGQANGPILEIGPFGEANGGNITQQPNQANIGGYSVFATANLDHVVYETGSGRLWAFDKTTGLATVYEYAGTNNSVPLLVGVTGGYGSPQLISECETELGGVEGLSRAEALSADGRTVYFTPKGLSSGQCGGASVVPAVSDVYARVDGESGDAHTVLISGATAAACTSATCIENTTTPGRARDASFEGASGNGEHVFFTDTQQLTNGASQDENSAPGGSAVYSTHGCSTIGETGGCNLYESVCKEPCGSQAEEPEAAERQLIDLSEGAASPRVQGVMAISPDGSHVYFVARGVLTGTEHNQNEETALDGEDNLYVYAQGPGGTRGKVTFITRLSPSDGQEFEWNQKNDRIANVTPEGRYLLFTNARALTRDDTRPEGKDAEEAAQVYEYDAQTRTLARISIGQDAYNDNGNAGTGNAWIAEARRGGAAEATVPVREDPTMSANGEMVFFESPIALTPGALNDVAIHETREGQIRYAQNIYEYRQGHVYLISDGKDRAGFTYSSEASSEAPTELVGVGESGADVIFSTFDPLVPQDGDTAKDYYDARIGGGFPAPAHASCEGEACHPGGSAAGPEGAPASESFTGPGNLAPPVPSVAKPKTAVQIRDEKLKVALKLCRKKHNKSKRTKCEKAAHKAYGAAAKAKKAKKSTRATSDRRAGR